MKHLFYVLVASLLISATAGAQTTTATKKTDKKEIRQDVRTEKTDRRQKRQDVKAAHRQTKKAAKAEKVSTAAAKHNMTQIAAKADRVADRSEAKAADRKGDAAKQSKEIKNDNKAMRGDVANAKKEGVSHAHRKTVHHPKK